MTHCQSDPDSNAILRWHFQRYAAAGREASSTQLRRGTIRKR
jgi:hypothetical protein